MSKKRQLLIDTALDLFYRNGINSIGINEILKSSGVAKRTLYMDFESKEALILAALRQRHDNFLEWLVNKLDGASSDADLIQRLFHALASWFENKEPQLGQFRGCFFINTSAEFGDPASHVFQFCSEHKRQVRQLVLQRLENKAPLLIDTICLLKEGAITSVYMNGNSSKVIKNSLDILNTLCERLVGEYQNDTR